ncbi:MAG: hypothetical protein NTV77_03680 [Candidatus Azambacteria bacterium]|nr:hypothetical protein [Candidatus Azambacteria bacterium]
MFHFFQIIFHKVTMVIATAAIAVGLISAPKPAEKPIITNQQNQPVIEQGVGNNKSLNQEAESQSKISELEKEIKTLKSANKNSPVVEQEQIKQEQTKTTTEQNSNQRQNYDSELSQLIAEARQRISTFNGTIKEVEDFIPVVRATMNKYPNESIIQQSGQELINEENNFASISRSLVAIETERVNKLSSYLGLGLLPSASDFSQTKQQYDNYHQQYQASNGKIDSLMRIFVSNEKSVLEERLAKGKQELDQLEQLLSQQVSVRQQKLVDLKTQIKYYQNQYNNIDKIAGGTESIMAGKKAAIASQLNPLINEYYSPVRQTYLQFRADSMGGGVLYDPYNSSTYYNFTCDGMGGCSIYSQ